MVSRPQLHALGMDDGAIGHRTEIGRLHRIGPGIYAVGHTGVGRRGLATAALLHVGDGGGISHTSAARSWRMVGAATDGDVHVSVPHRRALHAIAGVTIHRPRTLRAEDLVLHRGFWTTTPERTLYDLTPASTVEEVTRMLEQMVVRLNRSPDDLHRWAHGLPVFPGRKKLYRAVDELGAPAVIRSEFERVFRSLCQDAGLPQARTNHRIGRWEVDAVYPEHGLAIELDSWTFHGGRWQFHRDRKKGLAISRAGFELLRLTWGQVNHEQAEVVETIRLALARNAAARRLG